uniref:C-type lectin domain-containing protein n=1 Tax=Astyanax mexicanus TaxID=7994 RepID=A0A8B9H7P4_ASTMX
DISNIIQQLVLTLNLYHSADVLPSNSVYTQDTHNKIHIVKFTGFCTLGICLTREYHFVNESKTWAEAQSYCREMFHTDLASVRNETELQDILRISNGSTVWIGLYRKRQWSDQSSSTFTYWRPQIIPESAEPDNGIRSPGQLGNEHCTAVDHSGYWKDENCLSMAKKNSQN